MPTTVCTCLAEWFHLRVVVVKDPECKAMHAEVKA